MIGATTTEVALLQQYLDELGDEISLALGFETVELRVASLDSSAGLEGAVQAYFPEGQVVLFPISSWMAELEHLDGSRRVLDDHVGIDPFRLSRGELRLIDELLVEIVGHLPSTYACRFSGERPRSGRYCMSWAAFAFHGKYGSVALELHRSD